jgi:hypothetical protein
MKRLLGVFVAVFLMVAFMDVVYARDLRSRAAQDFDQQFALARTATVEGIVLSHDAKCKCIVIKNTGGNITVQDDYAEFNQNYDRAKGLKIGAKAKVTYKTVYSIHYATKIEQ